MKHDLVRLESCDQILRRKMTSNGLPKGILIANCPANDVPQADISVATKISIKSRVTGEPPELLPNYVARAEIPSCHDGCPEGPYALTDGIRAIEVRPHVVGRQR